MQNKEITELLEHCHKYAMDLLMETGELFPFGALMDAGGRVSKFKNKYAGLGF